MQVYYLLNQTETLEILVTLGLRVFCNVPYQRFLLRSILNTASTQVFTFILLPGKKSYLYLINKIFQQNKLKARTFTVGTTFSNSSGKPIEYAF